MAETLSILRRGAKNEPIANFSIPFLNGEELLVDTITSWQPWTPLLTASPSAGITTKSACVVRLCECVPLNSCQCPWFLPHRSSLRGSSNSRCSFFHQPGAGASARDTGLAWEARERAVCRRDAEVGKVALRDKQVRALWQGSTDAHRVVC